DSIRYPIRFTYIGTLVRHKGVHVLIRAFNEVNPDRAILRIYGPTDEFVDYVQMLRNLVRNPSIEFCGRFENEAVVKILNETDVLVVPSIWYENSPITIHEAFLARVPVITARFGGMADLVTDKVNGLLFDVGDTEDLRRALQKFVDDTELVIRLRPDPSSVKSMEQDAEDMERLYEEARV
ncbi:MAG: glycosyltransferase, partial [bacterium]